MCYVPGQGKDHCPPISPGDPRRLVDYAWEQVGEETHCHNCDTITVGYVVVDAEGLKWLVTNEHFDEVNEEGACVVDSESGTEREVQGCIDIRPLSCCQLDSDTLTFEEFLELDLCQP